MSFVLLEKLNRQPTFCQENWVQRVDGTWLDRTSVGSSSSWAEFQAGLRLNSRGLSCWQWLLDALTSSKGSHSTIVSRVEWMLSFGLGLVVSGKKLSRSKSLSYKFLDFKSSSDMEALLYETLRILLVHCSSVPGRQPWSSWSKLVESGISLGWILGSLLHPEASGPFLRKQHRMFFCLFLFCW